jgi:hypothetical protein
VWIGLVSGCVIGGAAESAPWVWMVQSSKFASLAERLRQLV